MKLIIKLIIIIGFVSYSCTSKQSVSYYKFYHKELYNKNNKKDTIYISFKHSKNEKLKIHLLSPPDWYDNNYSFNYPKLKHHFKGFMVYYKFVSSTHRKYDGKIIKRTTIEKNKKFLKTIKDKIYTYQDFKNKNKAEIGYFFAYNRYKTVYLIDERENKDGKIYLRDVYFVSSFPVVQ